MKLGTIRLVLWSLVAFAAVGLVTAYGVLHWTDDGAPSGKAQAELGAPFSLLDHTGEPITEAAFAGRPTALFFGFTHCPEVCPTTLYEMAGWIGELGEEGKDLMAYFVTVDPERDTPEVMQSYVTAFTDRITGITGDEGEIARLADAWGVYHKKVPLEDGDYTMDHTASVFLVQPDGQLQGTIAYGESNDTAVQKLRMLLGS